MGLGEGGAWTNPVCRKASRALHIGCVWTVQPQGLLGAAGLILTHGHGRVLSSVRASGPGQVGLHAHLFPDG